ncbi:hypothetical protein [Conexibacter sp. DBS9H8]|uniref:hypothetical protein n=1 Tax=Conexibacter sp. DBS9H8 TaxID=2937801 RepID=UPI00200BEFAF|nr:hypothetical protein [Conexibacter sp. DBS9H8]
MPSKTLAMISIPIVTGVIGYVTNWTGVLMLFYPVRFRGLQAGWLRDVAWRLPHRLQQIPGVMVGGIGWQGIIPSRAAKMGSLAVDVGLAKLGTPREFFDQLDQAEISAQILSALQPEVREIVNRVMARNHPRLWRDMPERLREALHQRIQDQLPRIVDDLTGEISAHIDQLVDIKLMVIRRFDPELANRVFLDIGARELRFIQNFGFGFGFLLGIPVAALTHLVHAWWLLPIIGVLVGYTTNWVALWMIYEPANPVRVGPIRLQGLFVRRQPEVAEVYAAIVADDIVTVANFAGELLYGPQSDRTRALIETGLAPALDRAVGLARPAVRAALGSRGYDELRRSIIAESEVSTIVEPLAEPAFSRSQAAAMRSLITERMRRMSPSDFAEMLHTATREDEWLLLLHGAVLGFAGGLIHLMIFG